jgi:FkbM family methyltransferase
MTDEELAEYARKRAIDRDWAIANGFNNGDAATNGELKTLMALRGQYDCFVDVGANHGLYIDALNAAGNPPFVLAFEPHPALTEVLVEKIGRGQAIAMAVSSSVGQGKLFLYRDDTSSSLGKRIDMMPHYTKDARGIEVQVTTLDHHADTILENTTKAVFLKIDVEGNEVPVLKGAMTLLGRLERAFVLFEFSIAWGNSNHTLREACHLLDTEGYSLFRILPFGLEHLRFYTPAMDSAGYCNYFAVKGLDLSQVMRKMSMPSTTHGVNDIYLFDV